MPDPENQSPRGGLRQGQRRAQVFEDNTPYVVSDTYADADLVAARADATWGPPVDCRGRDDLGLLIEFTKVAGQTSLVIAFQDGSSDSKQAPSWYDRHGDWNNEQGLTLAIPTTPRDLTLDVSGFADGDHQVSVRMRPMTNWMRFKPYGAGTVTGARCTIRAVRVLRGG